MEGTIWAFVPAIVAIVLALVTKQVYVSLFLGIFVGAFMYAGGDPLKAVFTLYQVMSEKVGSNTPIIVFFGSAWDFSSAYAKIWRRACVRRMGRQKNQIQERCFGGNGRAWLLDFRGRLFQLLDGRFGNAPRYGQV